MRGWASITIGVMAGLIGWSAGLAVPDVGPLGLGISSGLVGLAIGVSSLVRPSGEDGNAWRRVEVVGAALGATAVHLAGGGDFDPAPVMVVVLTALVVRSLADSTMTDIELTRRVTNDPVGAGPVRRIRTRMLALGVVVAALSAYAEAARVGLFDLTRPATGRVLVPVLAWFGLGLSGVGAVGLSAGTWRWERDGFEIDDRVRDRWIAGTAVLVSAAVLIGLALPLVSGGSSALPARGIAGAGGIGAWVSDQLERLGDIQPDQGGAGAGDGETVEDPPRATDLGDSDPPEWLGDVVLAALIGSVFVLAVRAGRRSTAGMIAERGRPSSWREVAALIRAILTQFWRSLAGLLRFLRRIAAPRGGSETQSGTPAAGTGIRRGWSSADAARRRVARAFARLADLVDPRPGETPVDVAASLSGEGHVEAETVVESYRRARYSSHAIRPDEADRAERAADAVVEHRAGDGAG